MKIKKGVKISLVKGGIRVLISILLGFLPSFLFIVLFVQYGSPFSNYIKFLSNLNASWIAWISAVIIALLIYFIGKIIKFKRYFLKKIIKNKIILIAVILCFILFLVLISTQLYLYVNFTLKNDILVKLSADKDNLFFTDNPAEEITFRISVTMNPFCSAQCSYEFFDISKGKEIEWGSFGISSIFSKSKTYTLNNSRLSEGSQTLNRFEISCKSKKTVLCYTKEKESKRAVLITLNYGLSEEDRKFKNDSKEEIISLEKTLYSIEDRLNESNNNLNMINASFFTEDFIKKSENLSYTFSELNNSFPNLKRLWEIQNFALLRNELPEIKNKIQLLDNESGEFNSDIILNISLYNNLAETLITSRQIIEKISQNNLNENLCNRLNRIIVDFNETVQKFKEERDLPDKKVIVENIAERINELSAELDTEYPGNAEDYQCIAKTTNNEDITLIRIIPYNPSFQEVYLNEPVPACYFFGRYEKCCDDSCSGKNYPVIFLHGYSMNKALPADYSLASFTELKEKLASEGYIDAGAVIISRINEQKGLWGKTNNPITVTASYFFDTYKTGDGETTVQSKIDNIDTYAIRLKSIIDLVKYRTNKDKVIIIAHSMGGLVTRRYIQIFGGKDVDRMILITIPNHGIEDKVRDYCALLGPEVACRDMDKDGLFINRLDNSPTEIVPAYNIIGIGCSMGDETGDGIVKNSTQYLDYATNYYVNGTCNELNFDFFHESILYPEKYPEVYTLIKNLLK